jgi:RNA polymerase sigma-70 factor (ECF subfamily)
MATDVFDAVACLARVRQRDEEAARELVDRLWPLVERIVRAHLNQQSEIQDLMQEVFLKVFSRLDQYRGQVPLEHWVSRVAVSTCLDRLRAQKRRPAVLWSDLSEEQQEAIESSQHSGEENPSLDRASWEVLDRLMGALAPVERAIVTWLDLEQRSIREVCELSGWNAGVVRIRAFRARRKLKALYLELERGAL